MSRFESKPDWAFAIADLTNAYGKRATKVQRGVAIVDRRAVVVQDEIEASKADIWWFMHTKADVTLSDNGRKALLTLGGERLEASVLSPAAARFEVRAAEPLLTSPNPSGQKHNDGVRKLAIHLQDAGKVRLTVMFMPRDGSKIAPFPVARALSDW